MQPAYRRELKKVLLEYLTRMHDFNKDRIFREIIETNERPFTDAEVFDWKEAMEPAWTKRKFLLNRLLNRLFREQRVPKTVREHLEDGLGYYRM